MKLKNKSVRYVLCNYSQDSLNFKNSFFSNQNTSEISQKKKSKYFQSKPLCKKMKTNKNFKLRAYNDETTYDFQAQNLIKFCEMEDKQLREKPQNNGFEKRKSQKGKSSNENKKRQEILERGPKGDSEGVEEVVMLWEQCMKMASRFQPAKEVQNDQCKQEQKPAERLSKADALYHELLREVPFYSPEINDIGIYFN